jgi:phospholipid/cholesterol/gamma-HCH transport system substrate-binding protein
VKGVTAGVKVGILFLLMTGGGYLVWKNIGASPAGASSYPMWAKFRDASGLPLGSKVVVAGLPVGEITGLDIEGRYAKVTFRVRGDVKVWDSGVVFKKATSLLGDNYLEIDPGSAQSIGADGIAEDHQQLVAGAQIERVVEATSVDQLLRRVEETLPNVDAVLLSVQDLSQDVRRIVNGPLASVATKVDALVDREGKTVSEILARANRSMARIEQITNDIRALTGDASPRVARILDNLDAASAEAKGLVASAKNEVELTGQSVRSKLDKLDAVIADTESITSKIDDNQGTLGRLVNDPAIADNVEEITDDAKDFLGTLFNLQTYVGLRSEYNVMAGLARHYVSVELHTRPDKFYLIELEKGPRGDYPEVTLEYDPTVDPDNWIRKSVIRDTFRFTFQFAKRLDWLTLRYGIKESTGGVGADADLTLPVLDRKLRLSLDAFEMSFDKAPRLKATAAFEFAKHLYILGGIDEALNAPGYLTINAGTDDVPVQFDELRYGRDFFLGAMLRFNDEDLAALLTVGGSALGAVGGK